MRVVRACVGLGLVALTAGCPSDNDLSNNEHLDTFFQSPSNEVDILWVVDNSTSMAEEQDTLARGFSSFTGQMEASGTDFHIGVISTSFDYADPNRGVLVGDPPFLTNADDYEAEFAIRAQLGITGSDKEKGLEAAAWALSPAMTTGPNAGFLRKDAQLLIVIVSDEEDCSDEGALEGQPSTACYTNKDALVPIQEYVQAFQALKDDDDKVQVGAIIGIRDNVCADPEAVYPSIRYGTTAGMTGGMVGDICLADWSGMLTELGLNATGVRTSFQLSHGAVPDTLIVMVDGVEIPADPTVGYTYDPATWYISFAESAIPPRESTITAEYTIDPQAIDPSS